MDGGPRHAARSLQAICGIIREQAAAGCRDGACFARLVPPYRAGAGDFVHVDEWNDDGRHFEGLKHQHDNRAQPYPEADGKTQCPHADRGRDMRTPASCDVDKSGTLSGPPHWGHCRTRRFRQSTGRLAGCLKSEAKVPIEALLKRVIDADASLTMFGSYSIMGIWKKFPLFAGIAELSRSLIMRRKQNVK